MLAFKTSAADIVERLLLSEVNHYTRRLLLRSLSYTPISGATRSENKKGWTFLITNIK
jgi:hypothetical protein